jgi:hypothetical protein
VETEERRQEDDRKIANLFGQPSHDQCRAAEQISFAAAETARIVRLFPPMRAWAGKNSTEPAN